MFSQTITTFLKLKKNNNTAFKILKVENMKYFLQENKPDFFSVRLT